MVLLGSASDFVIAEKAINVLETMEIPYDVRVASAHRTHQKVKRIVEESTKNGVEVFMGIAGLSAHLPGIIAANTHKPVVAVPVEVKLGGTGCSVCISTDAIGGSSSHGGCGSW